MMKGFSVLVILFALMVAFGAREVELGAGEEEAADVEVVDAWAAARAEAKETSSAGASTAYSTGPVTFDRGAGGHFYTDAQIGAASVRFLVDTGATGIALTEKDARAIGIALNPSQYRIVGRQVSGHVRGQMVVLPEVRVGPKNVRDVDAVVIEGATMNLLGQSFLTRAGKIEMDGEKMVLR
ncbi:TIGR02281 family clan AA aspartic protease [Sphingomicrobium sp. XHP0235]|uniref:retropepsin-like aspartic protease family protein n=1 Tax=Sphingomicrobium aquimarinum TaxID=3133971 RepID=UPI0031FF1DD4